MSLGKRLKVSVMGSGGCKASCDFLISVISKWYKNVLTYASSQNAVILCMCDHSHCFFTSLGGIQTVFYRLMCSQERLFLCVCVCVCVCVICICFCSPAIALGVVILVIFAVVALFGVVVVCNLFFLICIGKIWTFVISCLCQAGWPSCKLKS